MRLDLQRKQVEDLRSEVLSSKEELKDIKDRLERTDSRSKQGPWTLQTLNLIAAHPGRRAPELAEEIGMETQRLKTNVRKLKELGLTESLQVGYRLSPRGSAVLKHLQK